MSIEQVLAVVPVADFEAAHAWYERLFGRPADNLPMAGRLVEWRVTENGWVQVTFDADRSGWGLLNFAVDHLDRGICWDNAMAESFFATLKTEFYYRRVWPTKKAARIAVGKWIEDRYNRRRRHASLGQISPVAFELQYSLQIADSQKAA